MIAAEGEHKASRALRHAAEVIIDSPAALQVYRTILRPSPVVRYLTSISFGWIRFGVEFLVKGRRGSLLIIQMERTGIRKDKSKVTRLFEIRKQKKALLEFIMYFTTIR